jgi:hypothetical protein
MQIVIILFTVGLLTALMSVPGCGGSTGSSATQDTKTTAEPGLPLIQQGNLVYQGAFRVPKGRYGASQRASSLSFGGAALYFNKSNNSLFMIGHVYEKMLIELSVPNVINGNNINELQTATVLQPSIDISEGNWNNLRLDGTAVGNGGVPGGFLISNDTLIGSSWASYDGPTEAARSHFTASPNWSRSGPQFKGMYRVGVNPNRSGSANGGFVGGYMAHIPADRQAEFGGPALTGMGAIAIISRSSFGPCAWVFNPDDLGVRDPSPATMLVGYPAGHTTLGAYSDTPSLYYNRATEVRGLVFPEGSNSVLFFGRHGLGLTGAGDSCYGYGTSDKSKHKTVNSDGVLNCYDPTDSSKGVHAYPYVYRVWAYNAGDLLKVKNGIKKPWDITPYAIWNLDFPFAIGNAHILGAAYDPTTQRVFISQQAGDKPNIDPFPLIHVYKLVFN